MNETAAARGRAGDLVTALTVASFLLGTFGPTSLDGVFHPTVGILYSSVAVVLFSILRLAMPAPSPAQVAGVLLFWAGISVGTAFSPFVGEYSPGLLPIYAGLTLFLLIAPYRLPERGLQLLRTVIRWTGLIYAIWVTSILLAVPLIQDLTIRFFPAHYQELVHNMVLRVHHPVTAWGSHSIAALAFFMLFLYFRLEATTVGGRVSMVLTVFWVGALFSLRSNSGVFFGVWSLVLLLVPFLTDVPRITRRWRARRLALIALGCILAAGIMFWEPIAAGIRSTLELQANGFSGRYSSEYGRIYATIVWIRDNPLNPIGVTYTGSLVFGDSGYVEYFLRGSVLTLTGAYLSFVAAARRFLGQSLFLLHVCGGVMAFELGFSALSLWRFQLFMVPILVSMHAGMRPATEFQPVSSGSREAVIS